MEFQYLVNNGLNNSVQECYSQSELRTKTVIRNELSNSYIVFNSKNEFESWYNKQSVKHYHEIIFGYQNQRLKLDIDIIDNIDIINIISVIIDTFIQVLNELYYCIDDIQLSRKDFIITDSSGNTSKGFKHSYHIILYTYAVANNIEAKYITDNLINKLSDSYKQYIDINVNKSIQSFRLLHSVKCNSDRIKQISNKFKTYQSSLIDTMIVPFNGIKILTQLCENDLDEVDDIEVITDTMVKNIIKLVKSYNILDGHKFRDVKNNTINFDRTKPTHCTLCDEIHHNDNSLIIIYDKLTENVYEYCRQSKSTRFICSSSKQEKKIKLDNKSIQESSKFDTLSNKIEYNEKNMRDYELVDTLVVKAQMKVGKTKALYKFVKQYFDQDKLIRFISFRQTFSNHIYNLFDDFELYSNIKGTISSNVKRVIIQVESLYRLHLDEKNKIDLLILDEIESILDQLGSGLHKNFNASFAMFLWLLSSSKHVICMDANISNRTFNILSRFRNNYIIHYHHNKWQSSKDDIFYITIDKNIWLSQLCTKLMKNNKIVITTNSILEAKTCEVLVRELDMDLKVKMYSSELKYSEKQLYFNDVHKYWSELDVLIYTPTCSAGVSFELEHFDVLFGYFCNTSCNVETCRQMIHRVRNIKDKEYYIFFQELDMAKLPTTSDELHKYLYNKRTNMFQYVKDSNLQYSYNIDGTIKFYETDYYYIWLENMVINNLSKNNFMTRFINQIRETGAQIKNMEYGDETLTTEHVDARKLVEDKHNTDISNANELSQDDVETILHKISNQMDVELSEYQSYEKYKLRKCYNYTSTITPRFVEYYNHRNIKTIYQNLCDISKCKTIGESLKLILKKENERYGSIVNNTSKYKNKLEYTDLHNENTLYTSISHIVISRIISLVENKVRKKEELEKLIDDNLWSLINKHKEHLSIDLNVSITEEKIKVVNKLLKTMYGLFLKKNGELFTLKKTNLCQLFTFNETNLEDTVTIITSNNIFLKL